MCISLKGIEIFWYSKKNFIGVEASWTDFQMVQSPKAKRIMMSKDFPKQKILRPVLHHIV